MKKLLCSKCGSADLEVDTTGQEDIQFSSRIEEAVYIHAEARCLSCGASGTISYEGITVNFE